MSRITIAKNNNNNNSSVNYSMLDNLYMNENKEEKLNYDLDVNHNKLKNVEIGNDDDVINKKYVDNNFLKKDLEIDMKNKKIINVKDPILPSDCANKKFVVNSILLLNDEVKNIRGNINMNNFNIINLKDPKYDNDAINKKYFSDHLAIMMTKLNDIDSSKILFTQEKFDQIENIINYYSEVNNKAEASKNRIEEHEIMIGKQNEKIKNLEESIAELKFNHNQIKDYNVNFNMNNKNYHEIKSIRYLGKYYVISCTVEYNITETRGFQYQTDHTINHKFDISDRKNIWFRLKEKTDNDRRILYIEDINNNTNRPGEIIISVKYLTINE